MTSRYFFDSYALFEIVFGNEKYRPYAEMGGVTTIFNIAELNYGLKKIKDEKEADSLTNTFKSNTIKLKWKDILEAMSLKNKHKNLSIPDAIGYITAKNRGLLFLTGDEDFNGFENVQLVKK